MLLSDVCLSPKSRTERPRKTRIGTEVAHVTRDSDTTYKVKRSRSPDRFAHRRVGTSGGCSAGRETVLVVGNGYYVAVCSAAQGASAPIGGGEGRGIPWRPPAYNLFHYRFLYNSSISSKVVSAIAAGKHRKNRLNI